MNKIKTTLIFISCLLSFHIAQCHQVKLEGVPGYSTDMQDLSHFTCFAPSQILKDQSPFAFTSDSSQTSKEIAQSLNIPGSWYDTKGKLSADPLIKYLRSIEENDFSSTLNFLSKVSQWNHISYPPKGTKILNSYGKEIYKNHRKNGNNFGFMCGDALITDYEEGMALIFSLTMRFKTKTDKKKFQSMIGLNPSSMLLKSSAFRGSLKENFPGGQVIVSAFQVGGDPNRLASILSFSKTIKCDFSDPDACLNSFQSLFDYSSGSFLMQKDILSDNIEAKKSPFVPLGGYKIGPSLYDFGLKLPQSQVTPEILQARKQLLLSFEENMTYEVYLKLQMDLGIGSDIIQKNLEKVRRNLDTLENGLLSGPLIDCWKRPSVCTNISKEILEAQITLDFNPTATKLCRKPEESSITLDFACDNLKGKYVQLFWQQGNFMESLLPDEDGLCYAKAMGTKMTPDGFIKIPCAKQAYLPYSLVE